MKYSPVIARSRAAKHPTAGRFARPAALAMTGGVMMGTEEMDEKK